ncbi:hypothetical protein NM688_g900 [Phlebia brevispora]|uniref:Uncharacterized protein n=1 Tax=Phlebia brevispora TaxID=194682 RepID=A0ACC1TD57_9APHY|nr:hypothetical protein NM688_g900 [Phlebia brevispora]
MMIRSTILQSTKRACVLLPSIPVRSVGLANRICLKRYLATSHGPIAPGIAAAIASIDEGKPSTPASLFKEFSLADRVALVSGGNGTLGLEMALALVEAGARAVYCVDLPKTPSERWEKVRQYASQVPGKIGEGRLEYIHGDVTNQEHMWKIGEHIGDQEGRMDVCIAAAGVFKDPADCLTYSADLFRRVMDININGAFFTAQAAGRQMARFGNGGSIILVGSAGGSIAVKNVPQVSYNTSKSAVLQMARSMACELAPQGIRVNTLSPGWMFTDMTAAVIDASPDYFKDVIPMGRVGRPHELRGVTAWLASDATLSMYEWRSGAELTQSVLKSWLHKLRDDCTNDPMNLSPETNVCTPTAPSSFAQTFQQLHQEIPRCDSCVLLIRVFSVSTMFNLRDATSCGGNLSTLWLVVQSRSYPEFKRLVSSASHRETLIFQSRLKHSVQAGLEPRNLTARSEHLKACGCAWPLSRRIRHIEHMFNLTPVPTPAKWSLSYMDPGSVPVPDLIGVEAALNALSTDAPKPTLFTKEFSLADRVAVVTGAYGGLGLETVLAFVEAGVRVVYCVCRSPDPPSQWEKVRGYAARMVDKGGEGRLEYVVADVTDKENLEQLAQEIADKEGRLDICVISHGVAPPLIESLDYTPQDFQKILDTNMIGALYTAQAFGRQMVRFGRGGSIIFIASIAGSVALKDVFSMPYNMSKAAVIQMARNIACELGPKKIRVNSLSPGLVYTGMALPYIDEDPAKIESQNPLGRTRLSREIRGVVAWLASDASTFCTGSDIIVDGGHTAWFETQSPSYRGIWIMSALLKNPPR